MSYQRTEIPESDIQHQMDICAQLRAHFTAGGRQPLAMVDTYGCQQNEADSEKLRGYLRAMGFDFTQDEFAADVVVMNTCAVREHAETRVFGNVGALTHTKARNPNQIITVCGCMAQQAHVAEKLKKSYRIVDLVFGPHELWRFPELLRTVCTEHRRVFAIAPADGSVAEGIPQQRDGSVKAWLSIMYGCNNFCTYCIVPYVRGRERSRQPQEILDEVRSLVDAGYKDITLLGQNVNSYGKDLDLGVDFAWLLEQVNAIPGDFLIRFMTSHPKDAGPRLFDAMATCEKVAPVLHLPFQSGSSRVLKAMNRGYTRDHYLALIAQLRQRIPNIVDTMPKEHKSANFQRLLRRQNEISGEKHQAYIGKTYRCLVDGEGEDGLLTARTDGGRLIHLKADPSCIGTWQQAKITGASTWALFGELA